MSSLKLQDKAINLIHFDKPKNKLDKWANAYIKAGESELHGQLHLRHKMTQRQHWYCVPSVWASEGVFVKRSHLYPKLLYNEANANVTDAFYRVVTKSDFDIRHLVFSFYNSLTLALAELEGRFYGGGVLELTPNEFKNLLIPYKSDLNDDHFNTLRSLVQQNAPLTDILNFTDPLLLPEAGTKEITTLRAIRQALFNRRTKGR